MFRVNFIKKVIIGLLFGSVILSATDIKGKVNATNLVSKVPYSLKGVKIDLYKSRSGEWIKVADFITNSDGMYYFKSIKAGEYTIQVNGQTNYPVNIVDKPQQELAPIVIRYE